METVPFGGTEPQNQEPEYSVHIDHKRGRYCGSTLVPQKLQQMGSKVKKTAELHRHYNNSAKGFTHKRKIVYTIRMKENK